MNKYGKLAAATLGVALIGAMACPVEARDNANVQSLIQSNFSTRQAQLRNQITSAVQQGQLNMSAANNLLAQLDQINTRVQADLNMSGQISNAESNQIVAMFGSVTDQLNASMSNTYPGNNRGYVNRSYGRVYARPMYNGSYGNFGGTPYGYGSTPYGYAPYGYGGTPYGWNPFNPTGWY